MGWKSTLLALLAALLNIQVAAAATPIFSGAYVLSMTILCQAGLGTSPNLHLLYQARLETDIGTVVFNNATKKATLSGFAVFGETVQVQGVSNNTTAMHEAPVSFTETYANTPTTLTLHSGVHKIVYGKVTGGIVQNAAFQQFGGSITPNQHCAISGTLFRK